jgi:hypothetical protein
MQNTKRRIMVDSIAFDEAAEKIIKDEYEMAKDQGLPPDLIKIIRLQHAALLGAMRCLLFEENNTKTGGQNYEQ